MSIDDLRGNRDALVRSQRQAEERVRRIDDSKMRRLQVGAACLREAHLIAVPRCCLLLPTRVPARLHHVGACTWRAALPPSISL